MKSVTGNDRGDSSVRCHFLYGSRFAAGPSYHIPSHSHLFWHAELLRGGTLRTAIGTGEYVLKPGQSILLPPGKAHSFEYQDADTAVFSVKFEPRGLALPQQPVVLPGTPAAAAIWAALDAALPGETRPVDALAAAIADHLVTALAASFARVLTLDVAPRATALADRVRDLVQGRRGTPTTVREIARHLGFSERHVRNEFRRTTGCGLKEYIDRQRGIEAARCLAYSDVPVKEAAAMLGFPDEHCFSRFCRRVLGLNPSQIKRNIAGGRNINPAAAVMPVS